MSSIREATKGDYDIVVVGSRGLGAVGELLLGSVAESSGRECRALYVVAGPGRRRHDPEVAAR